MGKKTHRYIQVGELSNGSPIYIPLMVVQGERAGPVLWLCGATHGSELNGIFAMREIYLESDPKEISGTIVFTPIMNPMALIRRDNYSFLDGLDMDTQFPGKTNGFNTARIAFQIFSEIRKIASALVSFHAVSSLSYASPYTVSKNISGVSPKITEKTFRMALSFGLEPNCRVKVDNKKSVNSGEDKGSLDEICQLHGIPAFMAEIGIGGHWEKRHVAIAKKGIRNIMCIHEMIEGKPEIPENQIVIPRRKELSVNKGGFVEMFAKPGDVVREGEPYAQVVNLWEVVEVLKATEKMYMITTTSNPVVSSGGRIGFAGLEWSKAAEHGFRNVG